MAENFDDSIGAFFIGVTIAGLLWGIGCIQILHYYTTRPQDSRVIKLMVALMCLSTTTHQILIYKWLYDDCVPNFGNSAHVFQTPKLAPVEFTSIPVTAGIVQGNLVSFLPPFYIYKIWILSRASLMLTLPIITLSLVQAAFGILIVYISTRTGGTWISLLQAEHMAALSFSAISFALDSILTFAMCRLLNRNRTEYAHTNSIIRKLTVFVMSTNMLTAFLQLSIFIVYLVYPDHIYVVPMYCVIVQLYGNSFMAALNMRPYLRQTGQTRLEDTVRCDGDLALSPLQRTHHIATVNVFKETTVHRDLHLDVTDGKTQWNGPIEV